MVRCRLRRSGRAAKVLVAMGAHGDVVEHWKATQSFLPSGGLSTATQKPPMKASGLKMNIYGFMRAMMKSSSDGGSRAETEARDFYGTSPECPDGHECGPSSWAAFA